MAEKQQTYAIIEASGKQFLVQEGERVRLPLQKDSKKGAKLAIKEVMFLRLGDTLKLGRPYIEGALVESEIVGDGKDKKVVNFKYKRRKGSHRKVGHRQGFTEVVIKSIKG